MASAVYRSTSTEKLEWSWSSWNDSVCSPQSTLSYPIAFPSGLQGVHVDAVL